MPLTYVRMILRKHKTPKLQQPFKHRERAIVPSKSVVRRGYTLLDAVPARHVEQTNVIAQNNPLNITPHTPLTNERMVLRQRAMKVHRVCWTSTSPIKICSM